VFVYLGTARFSRVTTQTLKAKPTLETMQRPNKVVLAAVVAAAAAEVTQPAKALANHKPPTKVVV
jgi:hypothetical protein